MKFERSTAVEIGRAACPLTGTNPDFFEGTVVEGAV